MAFAGSVAEAAPSAAATRPAVRDAVPGLGIAAAIWLATRAHGGYAIDAWGPLGLCVLAALLVLWIARWRPPARAVAPAAALVALGLWTAIEATRGGVVDGAWTTLDQSLIAAAAFLLGSMLGDGARRAHAVQWGVLAGIAAHDVELLARLALSAHPETFFHGRVLYGLVGYQNAQAAILAIGVPPALALAARRARPARAVGAACAVLFSASVLLTESRGGLLALAVGVLIQVLWSRSLRLAAVALVNTVAAGLLVLPLRQVDRALFTGHAGHQIHVYVLLAAAAAIAAALLAQIDPPPLNRRALAAVAATALCALAVVSVVEAGPHVRTALAELRNDAPPATAPGRTRLASLSLNGRREAWRVALGAIRAQPLLGEGPDSFALRWTEKRRLASLYIIQPHSLELELLSELGVLGLGLFIAFVGLAYRGVAGGSASVGGVAAGVLSIVVLQASYDWTWSFPGLLVPALLIVGAACTGRRVGRALPATIVVISLLVFAGAAIGSPYLANRKVESARAALQAHDPEAAWSRAHSATQLDPWSEDAHTTLAAVAGSTREFGLEAREYHRAAGLALRPWVDYYQEAAAWRRAGAPARAAAVCRLARQQNPLEPLLREPPCG